MPAGHLYVLREMSNLVFSHFLIGLFFFLILNCMSYLYILEVNFPPFCRSTFQLVDGFLCCAKAFAD